jgi:hypothetical protein
MRMRTRFLHDTVGGVLSVSVAKVQQGDKQKGRCKVWTSFRPGLAKSDQSERLLSEGGDLATT